VRRVVHAVTQVLAFLAVVCIVVVLVATVADVARRSFSGQSVKGVIELGEVLMVAIVFLGLGYAESRGAHVSITAVVRLMPPKTAAVVNGLGLLLMIIVVGWMVFVTADRAIESVAAQEYRFGLVRVPVWPARIAIAVGLAVYVLELLFRLLDNIQAARGLRSAVEEVARRAPERLARERERLRAAVAELVEGSALDEDRLAREIALIADRWDIGEELVRTRSHLEAFEEYLEAPPDEAVGKRLAFLVQELQREVNTMGAKANDTAITRHVVEMKNEVERLREQVENVE
jgi:TRAP-type C4-dicarboxylate transport system permease small subunit